MEESSSRKRRLAHETLFPKRQRLCPSSLSLQPPKASAAHGTVSVHHLLSSACMEVALPGDDSLASLMASVLDALGLRDGGVHVIHAGQVLPLSGRLTDHNIRPGAKLQVVPVITSGRPPTMAAAQAAATRVAAETLAFDNLDAQGLSQLLQNLDPGASIELRVEVDGRPFALRMPASDALAMTHNGCFEKHMAAHLASAPGPVGPVGAQRMLHERLAQERHQAQERHEAQQRHEAQERIRKNGENIATRRKLELIQAKLAQGRRRGKISKERTRLFPSSLVAPHPGLAGLNKGFLSNG